MRRTNLTAATLALLLPAATLGCHSGDGDATTPERLPSGALDAGAVVVVSDGSAGDPMDGMLGLVDGGPSGDATDAALKGAIALSPPKLAFGDVACGSSSAPQKVIVKNTGPGTVSDLTVALDGADHGDFAQTSDCKGVLEAGESCTVTVTAAPTATGTRDATLTASASGRASSTSLSTTGEQAFGDLSDLANWSVFDLATVNPDVGACTGTAFDGRFMYFVPAVNGLKFGDPGYDSVIARFDTTAPFTKASSWETFAVSRVSEEANTFAGAVFDGRFLYLVPTETGEVARLDTRGEFDQIASWSAFPIETIDPTIPGLLGGTFDGTYVYFSPTQGPSSSQGHVIRLNAKAPFDEPASWSMFDLTTVNPQAGGFAGSAFDGRYVYFSPDGSTLMTRLDTHADFESASAWSFFDVAGTGASGGFISATFDGRYVYYVADEARGFARLDTRATFTEASAWTYLDVSSILPDVSYFGGVFDGRYVTFAPLYVSTAKGASPSGVVTRLDTLAPFDEARAWSYVDLSPLTGPPESFAGGGFDGQYVYLAPYALGGKKESYGTKVVRFDAKHPPSFPTTSHGSFL